MADGVSFKLDDRQLRRALRRLDQRDLPRVLAGALNRVAFEILEAEGKHVGGQLEFAGPSTKSFLADKGFRFDKATSRRLRIRVMAKPKTGEILEDHVRGASITAQEGDRLRFGDKLAVPVRVKRGRRGKVSRRMLPSEVIKPGRRGFVNPRRTAILQRKGRGRGTLTVLYALVQRAKLDPVIRFQQVAFETARRVLPAKLRREMQKLGERR